MDERSTSYTYDDEIDLRQYIDTLLRWWREILAITLLCAIAAFSVSSLLPPTYEATANIAMVKEQTTLDLGSAVTTATESDLAMAGSRFTTRLNTLAQLVNNPVVAERVVNQLSGEWFAVGAPGPAQLARQVKGEATKDTGLIAIHVRDGNPQRAAALASAWAETFVSFANGLYSSNAGNYDVIVEQLQKSEAEYNSAQAEMEEFLKDNRIDALSGAIDERTSMIARLQADKSVVLTTLYDQAWDGDLLEASVDALLASKAYPCERQTAVPDESDESVELSLPEATLSTAVMERVQALIRDTTLRKQFERQLVDVRRMQDQLNEGGDPESNALALFLLKSAIFETSGSLPGNLQLSLDGPIAQAQETQIADLRALEASLIRQIATLDATITQDYETLTQNTTYGYEAIVVDDPEDFVNATRDGLQAEVQNLRAQLEAEQARERELTAQRDLAWESYQTLARREAELRVDRELPESEVRLATPATVPLSPVSPQRLRNTALAGAVGAMLGVGVAFLFSYMGQKPFLSKAR